jgi:hypothetical protein
VFLQVEARVRVGLGIPHSKDSLSLLMVQYSKDTCVKKSAFDRRRSGWLCRGESRPAVQAAQARFDGRPDLRLMWKSSLLCNSEKTAKECYSAKYSVK